MLNLRNFLVAALLGACISTAGMAQELMIFPNNDQSKEKQEEDKFACYSWAKGETGFDPMAPPTVTEAPPQQQAQKGGMGRGAVRGAAVGQIVGGDSDSTWKGAAAGAATGAIIGNSRKRRGQAEASQQVAAQSAQDQAVIEAQMVDFKTAFTTCLEAKDYLVKY